MPAPPYSSVTVTPSSPTEPSFGHRSAGNSLAASIAAARGAISSAAKILDHIAQHVGRLAEVEVQAAHLVAHAVGVPFLDRAISG